MAYKIYTPERVYSIQEFRKDIKGYTNYLEEVGVTGKRIALIAENSYRFLIAFFALTELEASIVLVDCLTGEKELNEIVRIPEAKRIFRIIRLIWPRSLRRFR
ncbi:AMP-binding protein [Bacillus cereus]